MTHLKHMKPKVFLYNTALFAQICYIAGPSLSKVSKNHWKQLTTLGCANVKTSVSDKSLIIMICAVIGIKQIYTCNKYRSEPYNCKPEPTSINYVYIICDLTTLVNM